MHQKKETPTIGQMILSVLAAMFGVQSEKARIRDFQYGKPWIFIVLGILVVTFFVFTIVLVVKLVLSFAG